VPPVYDDGSGAALYAGGTFTSAGGVAASRVARWNGVSWSALGGGMSQPVLALVAFDDGSGPKLYAGGSFTSAGGLTANRIARWDGSSWSPLGSGMNDSVLALSTHDDGSGPALYAAGYFTTAGGVAANHIATWNGSTWTALGSGVNGNVNALTVHDDGSGPALIAGGTFILGVDSYVAKWGCLDLDPPTLSCPSSEVVSDDLGSAPGEIVTFTVTASDCQDPSPTVVCVPPSGSFFPRGTTIVTCTATDASGNESTCEFPVSVVIKARRR
jgi:hypothetical protein